MLNYIKRQIKLHIARHYWNITGSFTYYDQQIFFPKNSEIFLRTIKEGIYEADTLRVITALIKPGTEVFDIGTNIGTISIPILSCFETITLISVEASPNTLPYLMKTHAANKNLKRWIIIDKAVADIEKKINFKLAKASVGGYDSISDTKRTVFENFVEMDCTTIDTIWGNRNKPEVSFIKLDIEGSDLLALKGGLNCIKTCKPSILLEWNPINIKAFSLVNKDLYDFFTGIDYACFSVPVLNKVSNLNDLNLYGNFTENFLLIPN